MIDGLIGTILQVAVVLILCLVAWLIFGRRKAPFRTWVGLTGAPPLLQLLCLVLGTAGAWLLLQAPGVAAVEDERDARQLVRVLLVALVRMQFGSFNFAGH